MWFLLVLFVSATANATCGKNRLVYYDSLLQKGRTQEAFDLVLKDIGVTAEEKSHLPLIAQAGMTSESPYSITVADLQDSKSLACQRVANAVSKLREEKRVRTAIRAYHIEWEASPDRWSGCDIKNQNIQDSETAARVAITCFENTDIASHASAREIRAYLAQTRVADVPRLRDEDAETFLAHMRLFHDNIPTLHENASDNYYPPPLKRTDRDAFCHGVRYVRETLGQRTPETQKWQKACLPVSQ